MEMAVDTQAGDDDDRAAGYAAASAVLAGTAARPVWRETTRDKAAAVEALLRLRSQVEGHLLELVGALDAEGITTVGGGHIQTPAWLAGRGRWGRREARRFCETANLIRDQYPVLGAAARAGDCDPAQVRAIARGLSSLRRAPATRMPPPPRPSWSSRPRS